MSPQKIGLALAAVAALGAGVLGGAAIADAATKTPSTQTYGQPVGEGFRGGDGRGPGGGQHTAVTGTELAKVKAAVKSEDSTVTVTSVRQDADGSYDVLGTKAAKQVMLEVSKDLRTITTRTGGPGGHGGPGGPGGAQDTPVTGAEATKVTDAVEAEDSSVTVTSVRKDADGSYDALGTKAGQPVMAQVSKDLKTIIIDSGGPQG